MDDERGRRLVPNVIDDIAKSAPDRAYCLYAKSNHVTDGFALVTYSQLANAINCVSSWVKNILGTSQSFETIAYLGLPDLRYVLIILAAQKNGFKALLPSPRNSSEATIHLLQASSCRYIVTAGPTSPLVRTILDSIPMKQLEMMSMSECLDPALAPSFPFGKTFDQARSEPFVALHTSGSTGLPKLVVPTHGTLAACDAFQLAPYQGYKPVALEILRGKKVFLGMPPFHGAGLGMLLNMTIFFDMIPVFGPLVPLTADILDQVHSQGIVDVSCVAPSIIEELVKVPPFLERLASLDCIIYGGGPLAKDAGDKVREKTGVINLIGTTENFLLPTEHVDQEDWQYLSFSPCLGAELRHRWETLHELVMVRNPKLDLSQAIFQTFPHLQEYATKDLFSPHPSKPGLWLYRGRSDDVIVFSNGEKLNPLSMEGIIAMHSAVTGALISGAGRFQSSLLVEVKALPTSTHEKDALIDSLWPTVRQANESCPAHGRIAKDFILLTDPSKPMKRAAKGTIQRKSTEDLYMDELDALYLARRAGTSSGNTILNRSASNAENVIQGIIVKELNIEDIKLEDDLFALGLDSLKISNIIRQLDNSSHEYAPKLLSRDIYANPTVSQLSGLVRAKAQAGRLNQGEPAVIGDRVADMKFLAAYYAQDLPINGRPPESQGVNALKMVMLTGSTGSLGSHLLHGLLKDQSVAQIYCLNRARKEPQSNRQREIMERNGLKFDLSHAETVFLEVDLSQPFFGLSRATYTSLLRSVTHILHNAWDVNFNKSLRSFQQHIASVRRLVDFCSQSTYGASIFFTSTIGTGMNWTRTHDGQMPEMMFDDWSLPQNTGYAEAKFVVERLLAEGNMASGVKSTVCRIGQVAGPTGHHGSWGVQEWFPSLIASSALMGLVPETLGSMSTVDWIPVDLLSKVLLELYLDDHKTARSCEQPEPSCLNGLLRVSDTVTSAGVQSELKSLSCEVFHTVNPHATTYQTLLPSILEMLPSKTKAVPLAEWVDALEQSDRNLERNPALKLIDFYRGMVSMEKQGHVMVSLATTNAQERSRTLRDMQAVSPEWMSGWMRQWGFGHG